MISPDLPITKSSDLVIVLQCTDSNSYFLCSLSNRHKPRRYASVFCHNCLLYDILYIITLRHKQDLLQKLGQDCYCGFHMHLLI